MKILYDSKSEFYKIPFGCLRQEESCSITIRVPNHYDVSDVYLCIESDDNAYAQHFQMTWQSMMDGYDTYQCSFSLAECGLYFYFFTMLTPNSSFNVYKEGSAGTSTGTGERWQLTCFDKDYENPESFKGRVMYQIFPDRFYSAGTCDTSDKLQPFSVHNDVHDVPVYYPDCNGVVQNNDFFGGNLKGITQKLPYLKSLNVSILYLNPIFMSYSNHRYDTADFLKPDPMLGTEEDFAELCEKAHELGIKVLLDGVFSHTGCNSVYFDKYNIFGNGAYHHTDSPYRSWYQFNPMNPHEYMSWWGIETLPCTEEMNDAFLDFIIRDEDSVIRHWMKLGADGYRLDVADELPDEFIRLLKQEVQRVNPDSLVLGEVWEDASNKISYGLRRKYLLGNELDSVMNYPYKDSIIGFIKGDRSSQDLADTVMSIAENYPKPVLDCVMNSLSTHDTMRILTVLGTHDFNISRDAKAQACLSEDQLKQAVIKLKAASFLQFTLPGSPCIYYGDEAGSQGFEDPFNRRYFPWDNINDDLLRFYQELSGIKTTCTPLRTGDIRVVSSCDGVFSFSRRLGQEKLYAIISVREHYECFTNFEVVTLHQGEKQDERIVLNKFGFVLLKTSL